jgi:hypothetical protein
VKTQPDFGRSAMPWFAALVLGSLYVAELWREGAVPDPAGAAIQIVLGAPLVVAGSVLLAALEQEVRGRGLTARLRRWLVWTPRVLLIALVGFLTLLSLDVFVEGSSTAAIALGLLMHNLPALGLLAAGLAAWRWPWVGALGLGAFAAWWLLAFSDRGFFLSVYLLLAVLPLTLAALFVLSWRLVRPVDHQSAAQ